MERTAAPLRRCYDGMLAHRQSNSRDLERGIGVTMWLAIWVPTSDLFRVWQALQHVSACRLRCGVRASPLTIAERRLGWLAAWRPVGG